MQKGCKKDFDKNQYTKKFVFQCHTVTHGIDLRKSPLGPGQTKLNETKQKTDHLVANQTKWPLVWSFPN